MREPLQRAQQPTTTKVARAENGGQLSKYSGTPRRSNQQRNTSRTYFLFEGKPSDFKSVLGTRSRRSGKKDQYKKFKEHLIQHITQKLSYPREILPIVEDLTDPLPALEAQGSRNISE